MASVFDLLHVRSVKAEKVLEFLNVYASSLDETPWYRGDGKFILCSETYVEPMVLTDRRRSEKREDSRRNGNGQQLDRDPFNERLSPWEEIDAARYELPVRLTDFEQLRWRQAIRSDRTRLLLKGAPGGGKSCTTRHAIVEAARSAWAYLDARRVALDGIVVPIWVSAASLALAKAQDVAEAVVNALRICHVELDLNRFACMWLEDAIRAGQALVVIDALDELQSKHKSGLIKWTGRLNKLPGIRLIATCRTMHVDNRRSWLGWPGLKEVELAPLNRRQQRDLVRKFYCNQPELAARLEQLLNANYSLRHAARTPLLMTFACLLHLNTNVKESTSYAGLYKKIRDKLFTGEWRRLGTSSGEEQRGEPFPYWKDSPAMKDDLKRLLEEIGWQLFSDAPESNSFTSEQWTKASKKAVGSLKKRDLLRDEPMEINKFRDELERLGLLVAGGSEGTLSFVHRTLLEWNAARALARRPEEEWLAEAKQHFWFEPEWHTVLSCLAGIVDDATPLIEAVEQDHKDDDLFRSMLALRARLVGAGTKVSESSIKDACDGVLSFWRNTIEGCQDGLRIQAMAMPSPLAMNILAKGRLEESLLELARDKNFKIRESVVKVLGAIGSERAVDRLLQLTFDDHAWLRLQAAVALGRICSEQAVNRLLALTSDCHPNVRQYAAEALGAIASERAVDHLLELTRGNELLGVRWSAAEALGAINSDRAVDRLLELTCDDDGDMRNIATEALGKIGTERAVDRLLELARDKSFIIRQSAAEALGAVGCERAQSHLLDLIRENDSSNRKYAAKALGEFSSRRVVDQLLELTCVDDADMCSAAAEALGEIGSERAVSRLLELTHANRLSVQTSSAMALGKIGSERAVDRLLQLTFDDHAWLRLQAVVALGRIRSEQAVNRLLALTSDCHPNVRQYAAEALGAIGCEQAVDHLLELTRDGYSGGREYAANALGAIGCERAVGRLLELTYDDSVFVRESAVEALMRISIRHSRKILQPD